MSLSTIWYKKWQSRGCYYPEMVDKMNKITEKNNGKFFELGHHKSHAANASFQVILMKH